MGSVTQMIVAGVVGGAVSALFAIWLRSRERSNSSTQRNRSGPPSMHEVERLVAAGRKIEAIKVYRELHDVGLKEAKQAVDRMKA